MKLLRNVVVLLALLLLVSAGQAAAAKRPPNIVLILADDLGYECLGCNGGTSYQTPILDKLATAGLRFEHCHAQPLCTPSRVQLMTGIYNNRNYLRFGILHPEAVTFAQLLKKAGYATCIAGKWQLEGGLDGPRKFGFDEYCLWQLTRRPSRYANPGLEVNGKLVDYTKGEYGPDIVSDYLCDFIGRHKDRPFLAYYPMMLPHFPFEPTPDSPDYNKAAKIVKGTGNPKYFADMVAYTDKMVGKVLARLDELGLTENTLVLFTGDNGTYPGITSKMGERSIQGGKGKTLDTGTHVPLIARWPGHTPRGAVNRDLIDFSDVLPTLLEAAGSAAPADIDGRSFLPQLEGRKGSPREWIYCWYERNGVREQAAQLVRDQTYKLYADGKFYDVAADPQEKQPLEASKLEGAARAAYERFKPVLDKKANDPITKTGPKKPD